MKLFNNVIQDPMNIAYGIGLAIITAGVLLFVIIAVKGSNKITPFCYLTTIILTPLLAFQFSLMFRAIALKEEITNISNFINGYSQFLPLEENSSVIESINEVIEDFQTLTPGISTEIGSLTLGKIEQNDIGGSLIAPTKANLNKYISIRIIWALLFSIIAVIMMIIFSNNSNTSKYRRENIRSERINSRRSYEGRRPNRRKRY